MEERLGVVLFTHVPDLAFAEMAEVARRAEELGYERVYTNEALTDTLSIDMLIACHTRRVVVGSFVAIIYYRHPFVAALAATAISEASGGRFILGLGVSHPPRNRGLGLAPGRPLEDMRRYVAQVKGVLAGETVYPELPLQTYQGRRVQFRQPTHPVPVYIAAVGPAMAELGGEIADGLMLNMVPLSRMDEIREAVARGASRAGRDPATVELDLGLNVFLSEDVARARQRARLAMAYFVGMPAYNRALRAAGFEEEARVLRDAFLRGDQEALLANITDEIIEEFCAVGPAERCRERIAAFRAAGADFVALMVNPVEPEETYRGALERCLPLLAPAEPR